MDYMEIWIEHIKHPLVLVGFGLFILAMLFKPILSKNHDNLSKPATERLISKSMNYTFILAFLVIIAGFVLSFESKVVTALENKKNNITLETIASNTVEQQTIGNKSPTITGNDVTIKYDGSPSSQKKISKSFKGKTHKKTTSEHIKQSTEGNKSPTIHSSGDVDITYAK